jgi:hypothetical protein
MRSGGPGVVGMIACGLVVGGGSSFIFA